MKALIVKDDGLIYAVEVPEEKEYCREFKGTDCQGSQCHCMLNKVRYDRALASAKESAVLCADQEKAKKLVLKAWRKSIGEWVPEKFLPVGAYPIPDLDWTTVERRANICRTESGGWSMKKESTPSTEQESQEAVQDRLWIEVIDLYLEMKEHSAGRMLQALRKQFTITRNQ